jgi:hypothetical protein
MEATRISLLSKMKLFLLIDNKQKKFWWRLKWNDHNKNMVFGMCRLSKDLSQQNVACYWSLWQAVPELHYLDSSICSLLSQFIRFHVMLHFGLQLEARTWIVFHLLPRAITHSSFQHTNGQVRWGANCYTRLAQILGLNSRRGMKILCG